MKRRSFFQLAVLTPFLALLPSQAKPVFQPKSSALASIAKYHGMSS